MGSGCVWGVVVKALLVWDVRLYIPARRLVEGGRITQACRWGKALRCACLSIGGC